jgi:formylglycine-generating enzyme required for sulfatase activity
VPGGEVTIGKGDDDTHYGWDNEYGRARYQVKDFKASKYLCSNQEFLGFIEAGGYHEERWWTPEGWLGRAISRRRCLVFGKKRGISISCVLWRL